MRSILISLRASSRSSSCHLRSSASKKGFEARPVVWFLAFAGDEHPVNDRETQSEVGLYGFGTLTYLQWLHMGPEAWRQAVHSSEREKRLQQAARMYVPGALKPVKWMSSLSGLVALVLYTLNHLPNKLTAAGVVHDGCAKDEAVGIKMQRHTPTCRSARSGTDAAMVCTPAPLIVRNNSVRNNLRH